MTLLLKETFFSTSANFLLQGNHGEDVKELYYHLMSSPTHSYMKALYKYPHQQFPYVDLREVNAERKAKDPEYEILDTGEHFFASLQSLFCGPCLIL
jgi:hypothetical protein